MLLHTSKPLSSPSFLKIKLIEVTRQCFQMEPDRNVTEPRSLIPVNANEWPDLLEEKPLSYKDFPIAQTAKNLLAMQETRVQPLGQEDPLQKGMAIHSQVFLPGEAQGQRSLVGYSTQGHKKSDMTE